MAGEGPDRGIHQAVHRGRTSSSEADVEAVRKEADEIVTEAVEFADASPEPPLDSLYDHLYVGSETLPGWYAVDERTPDAHPGEEERDASKRAQELAEKGAGLRRPGAGRAVGAPRRGRRRGRDRGALVKASGTGREAEERAVAVMRMREALNAAMREEMQRDENVFVLGEDVGVFQGAFKVTEGLLDEFGEKRVRDTPISENTIVGVGVGAAMTGLRPSSRS